MTAATPAKLRDGSWGARVQGTVQAGDVIRIETRAGKTWEARVVRVLWSGQGVTLVSTASAGASRPRHRTGRYECPECGEYVEPGTSCWETGLIH